MTHAQRRDKEMAYIADAQAYADLAKCRKLLRKVNGPRPWQYARVQKAFKKAVPDSQNVNIVPPFYCEYGTHITLGKNFFANYNCVMIDVAHITIGDNCLLGPNVSLYTAGHPVHPDTRNSGYEYGKAITIGNNCWLGGGTTVVPGVHIGNNVVIGAGSVVTRDIPDNVIACGNPCRVLRSVTEEDRRLLFRKEQIDDAAWADILEKTNFAPEK